MGLVLCWVRLGQTHLFACTTQLGIDADTVRRRCRHGMWVQRLVLFFGRLGPTHVLACATRLGIGADTVRLACAIW